VASLGEAASREAMRLARQLRRRGFSVEVGLEGRLKRSLELANKLGARFAVIIGEDELASGSLQLKDMLTGRQQAAPKEELIRELESKRFEHAE